MFGSKSCIITISLLITIGTYQLFPDVKVRICPRYVQTACLSWCLFYLLNQYTVVYGHQQFSKEVTIHWSETTSLLITYFKHIIKKKQMSSVTDTEFDYGWAPLPDCLQIIIHIVDPYICAITQTKIVSIYEVFHTIRPFIAILSCYIPVTRLIVTNVYVLE